MDDEFGVYGQVAGLGASVGIGGNEFANIQVFAQGSAGVAGIASIGISFDPFDLFDGDPNTHVFDFPNMLGLGLGTIPGSPVSLVVLKDARSNAGTVAVGGGLGDFLEVGGYVSNSNMFGPQGTSIRNPIPLSSSFTLESTDSDTGVQISKRRVGANPPPVSQLTVIPHCGGLHPPYSPN